MVNFWEFVLEKTFLDKGGLANSKRYLFTLVRGFSFSAASPCEKDFPTWEEAF